MPRGHTWRHLGVVGIVIAGFGLAIGLLRMVDAPGDLDLATPILLFLAVLGAEYRLLRRRKQALHRVIYRRGSFLGRVTRGRVTAFLGALGIAASTAAGFTIWAVSADSGAIWITWICTLSAAVALAGFMDLIDTQVLDPHARPIAITMTGTIAGALTAGWLGHHIWTTMPTPIGIPELLERTARQLDARGDMIGLVKAAALTVNEAQLIAMEQIRGVGLKLLYVAVSVLIVFLIMRSALVLVGALTVEPLRLPRGPDTGWRLAVQASVVLLVAVTLLAVLVATSAPVERLARSFAVPAGTFAQINRVVVDAYRPVHDAAAEFSLRYLHDPATSPDLPRMTNLVRDELLGSLDMRLAPAINLARRDAGGSLQQEAAEMIAQTISVRSLTSVPKIENADTGIARSVCSYLELGWMRCMLVGMASDAAPTPNEISGDLQQLALHAAIEQGAARTKLQLINAQLGGSFEAR